MTPAPELCPACGGALTKHWPESSVSDEMWIFECDASIIRSETGRLIAEDDCENAMRNAVRALNNLAALSVTSTERT
jgi:hypothetical protein